MALALTLAAGCSERVQSLSPPTDSIFYPTGIAVQQLPGGGSALHVVSSNIDLAYDARTGGTLMSLDTGLYAPPSAPENGEVPLASIGVIRVPSMGGELAVARLADCPALAAGEDVALFASRYTDELLEVPLDGTTGAPAPALAVPLTLPQSDPFGVAVKCAPGQAHAFVGHLRASTSGEITEVDLATPPPAVLRTIRAGYGVYGLAYQPDVDRLWVTLQGSYTAAPINVVKLDVPCSDTDLANYGLPCPRVDQAADVWTWVRGAELRDIAFANAMIPGALPRLYVAAQLFDPDLAARIGGRPGFDIGAALIVLDVSETTAGNPIANLVRVVPLGLGATQLRVLPPRAGKRDLVAVTSLAEGLLTIYDDDAGAVAKVFAINDGATSPDAIASAMPVGAPLMGRQPFGLAVEQRGGLDWIYVGSFLSNRVQVVSLDPDTPSGATIVNSIGRTQ